MSVRRAVWEETRLELLPQLTSHWLVAAACPAHRHPPVVCHMCVSPFTTPSVHFRRRCCLIHRVHCCIFGICRVARLHNVANVCVITACYCSTCFTDICRCSRCTDQDKTRCSLNCKAHTNPAGQNRRIPGSAHKNNNPRKRMSAKNEENLLYFWASGSEAARSQTSQKTERERTFPFFSIIHFIKHLGK